MENELVDILKNGTLTGNKILPHLPVIQKYLSSYKTIQIVNSPSFNLNMENGKVCQNDNIDEELSKNKFCQVNSKQLKISLPVTETTITFKINAENINTLKSEIRDLMKIYDVNQTHNGLSKRMWFNLYENVLRTTFSIISPIVGPTLSKYRAVEFIGFSRIDGLPMFNCYNQKITDSFVYDPTKNTLFETETIISAFSLRNSSGKNIDRDFRIGNLMGVSASLVSAIEDHIGGNVDKLATVDEKDTLFENLYLYEIEYDKLNSSVKMRCFETNLNKKKTVTFTISENIMNDFNKISDTLAINKSKFVENSIKAFIEKNK